MHRLNTLRKTLQKQKVVPRKQHSNNTVSGTLDSFLISKPNAKVCIIRSCGGIGDILMITPGLRQLKEQYKDFHLTVALDRHRAQDNYYKLLKNASFIDSFIDARYVDKSKYDYVLDISSVCIRHEHKSGPKLNRIDLFARAMGIRTFSKKLPFYKIEAQERAIAKQFIKQTNPNNKTIIALHTASFDLMRTWPVEKYYEVVKTFPDVLFYVFDFNHQSSKWKNYDNVIDCSKTSVREMAALIDEMDLFIGPDSGPMHLAGALQKRSIVLFGSIPPSIRINYYKSHEAIVHPNLKCLGCMYGPCHFNIKCMRDLAAELVINRIKRILDIK